jgi:hypothetical protein
MRARVSLLALLLVALLSAVSATLVPHRFLLDSVSTCIAKCDQQQEDGVDRCNSAGLRRGASNDAISSCTNAIISTMDACRGACKPVSKPPETPAATGPADTSPQDSNPPAATTADVTKCDEKCEEQFQNDRGKCLRQKWVQSGARSDAMIESYSKECSELQSPVLEKCKAACKTSSKTPEPPAGSADTKPPADHGPADTKPPESGSAAAKPPVENGSADPKPPEDANPTDTENAKAEEAGGH